MKNNTMRTYGIIILVVIVVIIVAIFTQSKQSAAPAQDASIAQGQVPAASNANSKAPVKPLSGSTSYTAQQNELANNQLQCNNVASAQYDTYYGNLQKSSFKSFYNPKSGVCYSEVTGTLQAPYATSTTAKLYFRNVSKTTIIAECSDVNPVNLGDAEWKCTDKASGLAINLAQFNEAIYNNAVK